MMVAGWDSAGIKTDAELKALAASGHTVAGFYLGGPNASVRQLGRGYAKRLHAHGFTILPIYVGYQARQLDGLSQAKIHAHAEASVADALSLMRVLRHEVPKAKLGRLSIDWEGPLTTGGKAYVVAFLDAIPGEQYLYRTDAGELTPNRHVWLAHPGSTTAEATALLGKQPYGHVHGVQNIWDPGADYSVWDGPVTPEDKPTPPVDDFPKPGEHESLRAYLKAARAAYKAKRAG